MCFVVTYIYNIAFETELFKEKMSLQAGERGFCKAGFFTLDINDIE